MFQNDIKSIDIRMGYGSDLVNLAAQLGNSTRLGQSHIFKLKTKQTVLRSLIRGISVPAANACMASPTKAHTVYSEMFAEYEAEVDQAKKMKLLLSILNFLKIHRAEWLNNGVAASFSLQAELEKVNTLISGQADGVKAAIDDIQNNSVIKGKFDVMAAKSLVAEGQVLSKKYSAELAQLNETHIEDARTRLFEQRKEARSKRERLLEQAAITGTDEDLQRIDDEYVAECEKLNAEFKAFKNSILGETIATYEAKIEAVQNQKLSMAKALKDAVLASSSVSHEDAEKWLSEKVEITKAVLNKAKKNNVSVEQLKQDIKDFYIITNGRMGRIKIDTKNHDRAYASNIQAHDEQGYIMLDNHFNLRVLWHELAHHLESDDSLRLLAGEYIKSRSLDGGKVHKLKDLTGNKGYGSREIAYKTDMFSHYAAKIYSSGETEVFSMGVESFYSNQALFDTMQNDPKTIEFVAGALMREKHEIENVNRDMRDLILDMGAGAENAELEKYAQIVEQLQALVTFSGPSFKMTDLLPDDLAYFVGEMSAKPFGELTLPNGQKYWLLQSSKVKYLSYRGRALKGVLALKMDYDVERHKEVGLTNRFVNEGGYIQRSICYGIQTQDIAKIKAMVLSMDSFIRNLSVKDTKGEVGEGFLSYSNLNKLNQMYLKGEAQ